MLEAKWQLSYTISLLASETAYEDAKANTKLLITGDFKSKHKSCANIQTTPEATRLQIVLRTEYYDY